MNNARWIVACITTLVIWGTPSFAEAQPVSIPPQADPGVVMRHYYQDLQYRFNQPWLYRPVTEKDLAPVQVESLIEIQQPSVSAQIVRPEDMTPVVEINKQVQ